MIHCYQMNGYNIVLDVYSGSVHAVDDLAYDIINLYESSSTDEIIAQMLAKYRKLRRQRSVACWKMWQI